MGVESGPDSGNELRPMRSGAERSLEGMGKLMYAAIASLDGFVEDANGRFDWAAPDGRGGRRRPP
jgi:hypothetical protein